MAKECNEIQGGEALYETVIGLEVHVELATKTKIFCNCSTTFGAPPNAHTCPVCSGMPGTLPVLNEKVLEYAVRVGLATGCKISSYSRFDRKNYFYPDNPQNYQISQLYYPICTGGSVLISTGKGEKRIGIHEIHMEEDAGKLIHDREGKTLIDFNRAGVPLLEIVSEPDIRNAEETICYLEELKAIIQYLGVSDCKLQEGSMRVDVNLSVRKKGDKLGTRTEMKNLSSFSNIRKMIANEERRQISLLEKGEKVTMETRRWDEEKEESFSMRTKEEAKDYRYFPDPDLAVIEVTEEYVEELRRNQPELPREKRERYKRIWELPEHDIGVITSSRSMAEIFEKTTCLTGKPKKVSNWLMGETLRLMKERGVEAMDLSFSPKHLAELIEMTERGDITGTVAKEVFERIFTKDVSPEEYVKEKGLGSLKDREALVQACLLVIREQQKSVEDYKKGKTNALGFLVGQTMKALKGQADPNRIRNILLENIK